MGYGKEYLEIGGAYYIIDLNTMSNFVGFTNEIIKEGTDKKIDEKQIDISKYEMVKLMAEVIFTNNELIDDKMGITDLHSLSTPYKLAFNSLLYHNILKEVE